MSSDSSTIIRKRRVRIVAFNMVYATLVNQVEPNLYWLNTTQYAKTIPSKTTEEAEEDDHYLLYLKKIMEKGKDHEDYIMLHQLYYDALKYANENIEIISQFLKNWDWQRVSRVEQVLMILCVTEWLHFPEIPVKVSLNEYMEIAKLYANPDESHKFINGILDKILVYLQSNKRIHKVGKGSITESKKKL
ncbi:MAG: transcription antitermination factor NusB [Bacteroidia bacterium]|nr:transcription antitermination factor NusB [Bacteroidia bacterium]MDW8301988.1 transcription antitermination factor NusB [Bacteroidia bacterium]